MANGRYSFIDLLACFVLYFLLSEVRALYERDSSFPPSPPTNQKKVRDGLRNGTPAPDSSAFHHDSTGTLVFD